MRRPAVVSLAGSLWLATACSAPVAKTFETRVQVPELSAYDSIGVQVTSDVEGADEERATLEGMLIARLESTGRFDRVVVGTRESAADCKLTLAIALTDINKVSAEARSLAPMRLAGAAEMVIDVYLKDTRTGRVIGAGSVGGSSGSGPRGGTTFQAIQMATSQILEFLGLNSEEPNEGL